MTVSHFIFEWFYYFLTNTTQIVRVNNSLSPQRRRPSGLFTLHTNECSSNLPGGFILKFSSDKGILSLLYKDTGPSSYFTEAQTFAQWCDSNHLSISFSKTQKMVLVAQSVGDHVPSICQVSWSPPRGLVLLENPLEELAAVFSVRLYLFSICIMGCLHCTATFFCSVEIKTSKCQLNQLLLQQISQSKQQQ